MRNFPPKPLLAWRSVGWSVITLAMAQLVHGSCLCVQCDAGGGEIYAAQAALFDVEDEAQREVAKPAARRVSSNLKLFEELFCNFQI